MLVEQAALLRRQNDEPLATINIIQEKLRFIEKESAQSRKGQFHIKTYPDRQFVHVGEELNLFTHELFYFYPTVGFYENGQKWFGAYLFEEGESVPNIHESAKIDIIPGGAYLCGYHYGNYQTIQDSIHALYEYGKGQALDSCVVTLNIIDQFVEGHPANYITALEARILTP